jgi:NADPH:quinone reductase
MKAIVCERFAPLDELVYRDVADPQPRPDQAVVDIAAAGVNYADALIVQGKYQSRPEFPFVPGSEFAGEVVAVGEAVTTFAPGDRVMGYSTTMGAYAERGAFHASNLMPVPAGISLEDAASLLCAHGTAHHALKQRGALRPGETLVVLGAAGGTGIAAIQIGKAIGARVIAACSTPEKLAVARENGADELIDYSREDLRETVKAMTDGRGADVIYDPVGGDAFDASTRCIARNGRLLVIGFASGRIPTFPVNLALVKEFAVVGVFWGNFVRNEPAVFAENMRELIGWIEEGKVHAEVQEKIPLRSAADALQRLLNRQAIGKIVLKPNGA